MKKIIYDIGSNNGDDIPYYLLKSDLVIAIEANPKLCNLIEEKFKNEIKQKRLVVENCVVQNENILNDVSFYIHKTNHVLSQFHKPLDIQNFEEIKLCMECPYKYSKILDLLHAKNACIRSISTVPIHIVRKI